MAHTTLSKHLLAQSTYGKNITVASNAAISATCFHVAPGGVTSYDEVWMYAFNGYSDDIALTILWGVSAEGAALTDFTNEITTVTVPFQSGRVLVIDGKLLQYGLSAVAYSSTENGILLDGFVNRITL
jgi:hypothetical protein